MTQIDDLSAEVVNCALQIHRNLGPGLLVNERLAIEIKSDEQLSKAHAKQVLTYLRLMKLPVGLLLNFAGATMKEGIRRVVNDYDRTQPASASPREI